MTGYGLRYYATFDSFKGFTESYRLNIFERGYSNPPLSADNLLFSSEPVIQEWQDDDPKQPVRGCTLTTRFITDSSGVHLIDFYSEDDLRFYCEFRNTITDQLLFIGFLLQDECAEIQVDYNHEIKLMFTDMLGTLKDVTLDQAAVIAGTEQIEYGIAAMDYSSTIPFCIWVQDISGNTGKIKIGQTFKLYDGIADQEFYCFDIQYNGIAVYIINIGITPPIPNTLTTYDLKYIVPYNLDGQIPIIDLIRLSLQSTYLDLGLKSFINIYPENGTIGEILQDTHINVNLFYDGQNWINCYNILEIICKRFYCSLFQCDGYWTIIRWAEIYRYTKTNGALLQGHYFDSDFAYIGSTGYNSDFSFASGTDMETGVIKSIIRPIKTVTETLNYKRLPLLRNGNNDELGALLRQYNYTSGGTTYLYLEYTAPYWQENPSYAGNLNYFIRVVQDINTLLEIERYLVIKNTGIIDTNAIYQEIYVSKNDFINLKQIMRYNDHITPPIGVTTIFYFSQITTTDGINTYYFDGSIGSFNSNPSNYGITFSHYEYSDNYKTLEYNNILIPSDGILRIWLPTGLTLGSADELQMSLNSLEFLNLIAGQGGVNGHENNSSQTNYIKNNEKNDIGIDNTISYSILETLYSSSFNGILRNRTLQWQYPAMATPYNSLGIATTQEELYQNYIPRAKYEGNLLYTKIGGGPYQFVNPLSVFQKSDQFQNFKFVPGKVTIDYKNAAVDLTLYEIINNPEGFDDSGNVAQYEAWSVQSYYEFKYLYDK